jgi:hypothetical protein
MGLGLRVNLGLQGRTIWIADAHRDDGQRFVVHADEILTAFLELEEGGLYRPIERTMLTIIAAMAAKALRYACG